MMTTPDDFRVALLQKLYTDAIKGNGGTDLEVRLPKGGIDDIAAKEGVGVKNNNTVSFHLHHNIVAASSGYFATFPEPKQGRVIDDIDSNVFSVCMKFMYTGELVLTRENVSSILYAAELLQIEGLKTQCMDFLECRLDHSNYEYVIELADRFNNPDLKKSALRFESENSSRDVLVGKRDSLVKRINIMKGDESKIAANRKYLEKDLDETELQLKNIFQKQHEEALIFKWENAQSNKDSGTTLPFAFGSGKKKGSIGHLVPFKPDKYHVMDYVGMSTYGDVLPSGLYYDGTEEHPPPPPTKEQYEQFGIVNSHSNIKAAIKAANPGDRIYIEKGVHSDHHIDDDDYREDLCRIRVDKALDFIGLGDTSEVIVEFDIDDEQQILVKEKQTGFYNITFRARKAKGTGKWGAGKFRREKLEKWSHFMEDRYMGIADDAIIKFSSMYYDAHYAVKNCVFDMGTDNNTAFATRVSGIFLQRGASAIIEGCSFLGGAGSAIVVVNDPFLYIPDVSIVGCSFVSCGQPSFSEVCTFEDKERVRRPIPSHEITPGPAAVELWRLNRTCYRISKGGDREEHKTVSIKMMNNKFTSNLRAPLAHRAIVPKVIVEKGAQNTWKLHVGKESGECVKTLAQGFDLLLKDNVFKSNGLQFDQESLRKMKGASVDRKEKKIRLGDSSEACKFPDGNSLLTIKHNMKWEDEHSFPYMWNEDLPFDEYRRCYTEDYDY